MPSKETKMSFPRLCAGGVCGHSSWDQRFGASEVGAVSGLQECFNVGSTEGREELKPKTQPPFFSREAKAFCFHVSVTCSRILHEAL